MSEWPSPLKSPVPTAFQFGPGIGGEHGAAAADQTRSRSSPRPRPGRFAFCHRMSERLSPLKSPVPTAFQFGPGLAASRRCRFRSHLSRSSPRPRPGRSAFCHRMSERLSPLKSPVPTVFQLGPGIGADHSAAAGDLARSVQLPDRGLPAGVLPQDVGKAVAVEVAVRASPSRRDLSSVWTLVASSIVPAAVPSDRKRPVPAPSKA